MSSNTTVQWHSQLSLGNAAPEGWGLSDIRDGMNTVLTNTNKVIDIIEGLVNLVSPFIAAPTDILASLIKAFSKPILTVLQDALSLGGSFIVIHPYNRINRRNTNIFTKQSPFLWPAMTPREAFKELYSSFYNEADPFRPQWGSNIKVAGVGLLITLPDVKGFVKLMQSVDKVISMKDFSDVFASYKLGMEGLYLQATKMGLVSPEEPPVTLSAEEKARWKESIEERRKIQTEYALELGDIAKEDIKSIFTEWKPSKVSFDFGSEGAGSYLSLTNNATLPRLHWWGLSIANFTFLKKMVDRLDKIIKTILDVIEVNDKLVDNIIAVLLKKVQALREIAQSMYDLIEGFAVSVYSSGVYAFILPQTPNGQAGGVDYIIESLQASLTSPQGEDAKKVANLLDDSENTLLMFAAASTGVNLDAWAQLFQDAFLNVGKTAETLAARQELQFTVVPEFNNAVVPFDTKITLKVVSAASTNTNQLYYTYSITSDSGTIHSANTSRNFFGDAAKVNSSTFDIIFTNPENVARTDKYVLEVTVFDTSLNESSVNYSFQVSNIATISGKSINSNGEGGTVTLNPNEGVGGAIAVIDPATLTEEEAISRNMFGSNESPIGLLPPFVDPLIVRVTTNNGNEVSFPIDNNTGYTIVNASIPIKSKYSVATFPAKLFIDEVGAIAYRVVGDASWIYVTLPGYIVLLEGQEIEYMLFSGEFSGNNNWVGIYNIKIGMSAEGEANIC